MILNPGIINNNRVLREEQRRRMNQYYSLDSSNNNFPGADFPSATILVTRDDSGGYNFQYMPEEEPKVNDTYKIF